MYFLVFFLNLSKSYFILELVTVVEAISAIKQFSILVIHKPFLMTKHWSKSNYIALVCSFDE